MFVCMYVRPYMKVCPLSPHRSSTCSDFRSPQNLLLVVLMLQLLGLMLQLLVLRLQLALMLQLLGLVQKLVILTLQLKDSLARV